MRLLSLLTVFFAPVLVLSFPFIRSGGMDPVPDQREHTSDIMKIGVDEKADRSVFDNILGPPSPDGEANPGGDGGGGGDRY